MSVVVPFAGSVDEGAALLEALGGLRLAGRDEVTVADNTPDQALVRRAGVRGGVRVLPATGERSSYHARNVGAEHASNEWILFLDADCRPPEDVLDRYFAAGIGDDVGAVAGEVVGDGDDDALLARYARSRRHLVQADLIGSAYRPWGVTANLLVRRSAWSGIGGFLEGIRSSGDADLCWRLQEAGWRIAHDEHPAVGHRFRTRLMPFARRLARCGAGRSWLARRYPGSQVPPRPGRDLGRCAAGVTFWAATGRYERATFKAIDAVAVAADTFGWLCSNSLPGGPPDRAAGEPALGVLLDQFPAVSETFVVNELRAMARAGRRVDVQAAMRPGRPDRAAGREVRATYLEDVGLLSRATALAGLVARHPTGCARDLVARRRWRPEEHVRPLHSLAPAARRIRRVGARHLHVHFAGGAALDALRLARITGSSYSVTAHAYDIFRDPRNLTDKLGEAAFTTTGCAYNVRHLRSVLADGDAERVHEIVMGVDGDRFRRRSGLPGGRTVMAVGRLVEKKGFADLLDAVALMSDSDPVDRLIVVGDGPLRGELHERASALALDGAVEWLGAQDPERVAELLERADVLAMPCVVAADGDRDSMPVVVKEALAKEVPVVGTHEVGMPELVRPEWGVLVAPHDPAALAGALHDVLARSPGERAAMGRAGRRWTLEHCSVDRETARLLELIDRAVRPPRAAPGSRPPARPLSIGRPRRTRRRLRTPPVPSP